jgi:hypothetical protein
MSPDDQFLSDITWTAKLALTLGSALVGAVLARLVTRRQADARRALEARAHGLRVRQLEASRREAIAELGRAATELAERALEDGRKAPRRPTVAPLIGAAPPWLPGFELYTPRQRELVLDADFGADVPSPLQGVESARGAEGTRPDADPARARSRAESWSIPLVPLPRRERGAS